MVSQILPVPRARAHAQPLILFRKALAALAFHPFSQSRARAVMAALMLSPAVRENSSTRRCFFIVLHLQAQQYCHRHRPNCDERASVSEIRPVADLLPVLGEALIPV